MEDERIVTLFWQRNEVALTETASKYGCYLHSIAFGILASAEDAEECVNDTYINAWNAMPPHRPALLSTFLGKLTCRISIDRLHRYSAEKRGGGEFTLVLEELADCVSGECSIEEEAERRELTGKINEFLRTLPLT